MRIRWLVNAVLALMVLALGALMHAEIQKGRIIPRLTDLAAADLYQIEISRRGEPDIRLIHGINGWRMEKPMTVDANEAQIAKILGLLDAPTLRSVPEESAALGALELSPPKLQLRLDGLRLDFGGTDPVAHARYVASERVVHLIQDQYFHLLIAPPIDFVSLKLLPRGFTPAFGRMQDAPLAADTLAILDKMTAERVEQGAATAEGTAVELKDSSGTALAFVVSEDHRRWAQPDSGLLYVLTDAPDLALDPTAVDPTPPSPPDTAPAATLDPESSPPADAAGTPANALETGLPAEEMEPADASATLPTEALPRTETLRPDDAVPDVSPDAKPPVVRLTPDGRTETVSPPPRRPRAAPEDSDNPYGFGQDPFAPEPPTGAGSTP